MFSIKENLNLCPRRSNNLAITPTKDRRREQQSSVCVNVSVASLKATQNLVIQCWRGGRRCGIAVIPTHHQRERVTPNVKHSAHHHPSVCSIKHLLCALFLMQLHFCVMYGIYFFFWTQKKLFGRMSVTRPDVTDIINSFIASGIVPPTFKHAIVQPLLKKDSSWSAWSEYLQTHF